MSNEEIIEAFHKAMSEYHFEFTFKPGMKTLLKITGAVVVANAITALTFSYASKKVNQLVDRIEEKTNE